ncbi:MAG: cytochrome c biogenesis protein CcsA [Chloroflexi bacterium]|nr:cytochrome c biogenesis protein CcsA [Chloroflexota bacterium]MCC6895792.1 cytochrome c biogenesis protein CcsA [Anaerolineae bacterium]
MSAVQNMPLRSAESVPANVTRTRILWGLTIVTAVLVAFGTYMALGYAPTEVDQGEVQRIFYFHLSSFAGAFIAFCVTVVGGVLYLRTRNAKWDTLALAGVEVGLALSLINLITGMIWARPIWNTWWTWDPRLTSAAIMILTYAAYLMLRNGIDNPEQRRRFASVYGILAFTTVIAVLVITRIRPDTIHPVVIGPSPQNAEGGFEMTARISSTIGINSAIWSIFVPITLLWWRVRLETFSERVRAIKAQVLAGEER